MKIFIHGLESSGKGFKGKFFKKIFTDILTPDFKGNFQQRMNKLNKILEDKSDILIIGSSYGGLMATKFAYDNPNKVKKLILLAPALIFENILNESMNILTPTIIFHGRNDSVVPLNKTKEFAEKIFKNLIFHEVDDDHLLHKTIQSINWKNLI